MKVTGYGTIKPTQTTRRREGSAATSSFSGFLSAAQTGGSSGAGASADVSGAAALGSLLSLQEISEEERKRERMMKRSKDMLDSLEHLRQQLLMGEIPAHMLHELSQRLEVQRQELSDPRLVAIMDEIELRLAVELAKLEMAFAAHSQL